MIGGSAPTGAVAVDEARAAELLAAAAAARRAAYVPYSGFDSGAAVLTDDGTVVTGALVENIVFGLSMCAERVALYAAVAQHAGVPVGLALVAPRTGRGITHPCGPCLQVAMELGGPDMEVVLGDGDEIVRTTIGRLGPELPRGRTLGDRRT